MVLQGPSREVYEELRTFVPAHPHARQRSPAHRVTLTDRILALAYRVLRRILRPRVR